MCLLLLRVRGHKIDIAMRIRALSPDGLIFWTGEKDMGPASDFLSIGIQDGFIFFSYNLGSGKVLIPFNTTRMDDGQWHWIRAQRCCSLSLTIIFPAHHSHSKCHWSRYEKTGYIEVDGTEVVEGTSPGALKQLNTEASIFIGKYYSVRLWMHKLRC